MSEGGASIDNPPRAATSSPLVTSSQPPDAVQAPSDAVSSTVHRRTSSLGSSSNASGMAPSRTRHRRRRQGNPGGGGGHAAPLPRSQLTLCCDAVTVQRKRGLVIDCVSGLFYGGRLTAVVNCCGTHSAFYLLNALAGQEEADEGNVLLNGTPVTAVAYQKRCVLLDEDFTAFEELTVRENLEYAGRMRVSNATQAYSVDDILQQLLLVTVKDCVVRDCSLYVRRRLSLGKELLRNPEVIILDQPLEGLVTHEAQQFLSILQKIASPAAADAAEEAAEAARQRRALQHRPSPTAGTLGTRNETLSDIAGGGGASQTPIRASVYTPRARAAAVPASSATPTPRREAPDLSDVSNHFGSSTASAAHELQGSSQPLLSARDSAAAVDSAYAVAVRDPEADAATAARTTTERIVILSMTQPRWALLQYVDEVLLLEESRAAFCGPVSDLLAYKLPAHVGGGIGAAQEMAGRSKVAAATPDREGGQPEPPHASSSPSRAVAEGAHSNPLHASAEADVDEPEGDASSSRDSSNLNRQVRRRPPRDGPKAWRQQGHLLRPLRESFVHALYQLASVGDGSLCRALGPNARANAAATATSGAGLGNGKPGNSITAVRAAIDRHLKRCAAGELTLTGWEYSSPGGFVQLLYLFKYSALQIRHNILVDAALFIVMITLGVVLAAIYGSQEGQAGMQNKVGILFFLVSTTFLQSILSSDSTQREYLSFQRHCAHGYYPTWVYLTFRVTTSAVRRFLVASVFALAVFLCSNFGMPWGQYAPVFELAVIVAVTSFAGYFLVYFICTFLWSPRVNALILFALYTVNLVLAGLVLNLTTLPRPIQCASLGTLLRLSFEASILTQFLNQTFGCDAKLPAHPLARGRQRHASGAAQLALSEQPAMCYTGREYASFLGFDDFRRWRNVGVMAGMAGVLVLLSFFMMTFYKPKRRAKGGGP